MSVTVCLCCVFARLRIIQAIRIKLTASNFAPWFIGVLERECPISGNFAPTEAKCVVCVDIQPSQKTIVLVSYFNIIAFMCLCV